MNDTERIAMRQAMHALAEQAIARGKELMRNPPPNPTRLSHWFPVVERILPERMYPKTTILHVSDVEDLFKMLDFEPSPTAEDLFARIKVAANALEYPVFLRNDLTSGKHVPGAPCIVRSDDDVPQAVHEIMDFEASVFMQGMGYDVWAVRELLPGLPVMRAFRSYSTKPGLPVGRERRFIVRDGAVVDQFPYWPRKALKSATHMDGSSLSVEDFALRFESITHVSDIELKEMGDWSELVACDLGGDWSVDWMFTVTGWKLIDMAEADKSWIADDDDREEWARATKGLAS